MSLGKQAIQRDGVIYVYGEVIKTGSANPSSHIDTTKREEKKKMFFF